MAKHLAKQLPETSCLWNSLLGDLKYLGRQFIHLATGVCVEKTAKKLKKLIPLRKCNKEEVILDTVSLYQLFSN